MHVQNTANWSLKNAPMASVKIILDKRRAKADGTFSINFQICYSRKTTTRSSKICVKEEEWDDNLKMIRKSHPYAKTLNLKLKKDFADLQSQLLLANEEEVQEYLNPVPVQVVVSQPKKTLYQFVQELINQMREDGQIGNAWVYESSIAALKLFHPLQELYFEDINYDFLNRYNSFLVGKDMMHNTIYLYVRNLRIFFNKAIKSKIVDRAFYPFDDYKLRPEKTKKRAVDIVLLQKISNLNLDDDTALWHTRNFFLLSFYLIGISIVDLALLKKSDSKNGRITYKRRKTGKWYDIKLQPQAIEILNHYSSSTEYLLPIAKLEAKDEEVLIRGIKSKTKLFNKHLGQIVKLLKVETKITTYTARHSWATMAKKAGFSIELIAEALGHEYGNRTTAVYLDTFEPEVIDDMNAKIASILTA